MPNLICGAPQPAPKLRKRVIAGAPAPGSGTLTRRAIAGAGGASGGLIRRRIVVNVYAPPRLARPVGARRVSGVIVPRSFAGGRPSSGVLIPRRAQAANNAILAGENTPLLAGDGVELIWGDS